MNKDQVMGITNHLMGQFQERVGIWVGSREQELRGRARQHAGTVQRCCGDAEEILKSVARQR